MSSERSRRPEFSPYYLYDSQWDTWKVHFTNKAALSHPKIHEFFSKYGEVVRIEDVDRELCYVHFKTRGEAKTCSWSMKDSSTIRLRPFKPNDGQGRQSPDNSGDKNGTNGRSDKRSPWKNVQSVKSSVNGGVSADDNGRKIQENNHNSDTSSASKPSNSYELCSSSTSASTDSIPLDSKAADNLPDLMEKMSVGSFPMKVIQPFFSSLMPWARPHPPILRNIELQDVVVANIHEFCGVEFILEMLEPFRPVCASEMEVSSGYLLRYCHVYFETPQQARDVESVYDNAELFGRSLIVRRSDDSDVDAERFPGEMNGEHSRRIEG